MAHQVQLGVENLLDAREVRDLVGSLTRPVKELKGFRRIYLEPEERVMVEFELHTDEFAFYGGYHEAAAMA